MSDVTFRSEIDVRLVQHTGTDSSVVAAAKVSTGGPAAVDAIEQQAKAGLIRYLMKQRHGTPFEHASLTFFVNAPIFVWREWHRHRIGFAYSDYGLDADIGQSFNEESARYKTLDPVFYLPPRDRPMMKVSDWKPGRPKFLRCKSDATYEILCNNLKHSYQVGYRNYLWNLELGIDPGLARDCLPVGIYSSCWVTCNPRSLMAFLSLRTHDPDAEHPSYPLHEIEQAARKCEAEFARLFPIVHAAFCEFGRVAP